MREKVASVAERRWRIFLSVSRYAVRVVFAVGRYVSIVPFLRVIRSAFHDAEVTRSEDVVVTSVEGKVTEAGCFEGWLERMIWVEERPGVA